MAWTSDTPHTPGPYWFMDRRGRVLLTEIRLEPDLRDGARPDDTWLWCYVLDPDHREAVRDFHLALAHAEGALRGCEWQPVAQPV